MKKIAKVGDITYEWEDSPDPEDRQAQQRLRNLFDLAISIGRREGLLKSSLPLPEDKPKQESG